MKNKLEPNLFCACGNTFGNTKRISASIEINFLKAFLTGPQVKKKSSKYAIYDHTEYQIHHIQSF